MAPRLRQAAAQPAGRAPRASEYSITGLDFNEALSWRAGKTIPVADLFSRLQQLGTELRGLEQGQVAAQEFHKLAQDLAHSNLLGHKDKGIRAWALCCIVDILNICAPDAPFKNQQLNDIFTVVAGTILPALADPANAYNAQHIYILNSLTDTKSIVLLTDLEHPEKLIISIFTTCFDIVSGASHNSAGVDLAKSVEFQLRSMLVIIIEEITLPQEATDIVLSQFLRVDPRTVQELPSKGKKSAEQKDRRQDTLHLKDYPPAYNMAKSVCTSCLDKMTAQITQYFGNIIMNASAALEGALDTKQSNRKAADVDELDDNDESLLDLRKAHQLVRELWRACPDVLINVIPQIEAELAADSTALRQMATETLGDVIAGIGIAGPPPTSNLDPAAYPLPSVDEPVPALLTTNPLLVPASPKPFSQVHSSAFQAFLGRRIDKSTSVRSAWVLAVSRILLTDAGGIGINNEDRAILLTGYAQMLKDMDDKVRSASVQTISMFNYHQIVNVLGADGGLAQSGMMLSTLAERVSDRKHVVREEAMMLLAKIWGVGSRDIENGVERVVQILGDIPSKLLNAMYVNDQHIHTLLYRVVYENLLPLPFPPIKEKSTKADSQKRGRDKNGGSQDISMSDMDLIRVRRFLTVIRNLDARAKPVFFGMQRTQADMGRAVKMFLKACEDYNAGVIDDTAEEQKLKDALTKYIQSLSKQHPDPAKASTDYWKFANMHDRRSYQLIRFATGPEYDYKTMTKAIKELTKRIKEGQSNTGLMDTLLPLLYRSALIVYSRSHVPAIMDISRTDNYGLADTAHEVLKEISAKNPEVLKSHIQALCKELEDNAPSASKAESQSAADTLKACAGFARKYPQDIPKERKFLTALTNFALFSQSSRAAKHAVTIVLTVSDKKELHAKDILTKATKNCSPESAHYLARLATISQICLLAPVAASAEEDAILKIALTDCLQKNRQPSTGTDDPNANAWEAEISDETIAKELSLKIMVNRVRSANEKEDSESFDVLANTVLTLLMRLVQEDGEMSPLDDTPSAQKNRLRLAAARCILKLCSHKRRCEELVNPQMFISMALIVINPPNAVRSGFVDQLKKYLGRNSLSHRWYTILFLLAFEPDHLLKNGTTKWLKSRVGYYARNQKQSASTSGKSSGQIVMESILARLLSLLAHHPDYPTQGNDTYEGDLLDFAKYIIFYLQAVANEENISLIFHIAQRVKQTQDAVTGSLEAHDRLYVLSDLAQAVIRNYADMMPGHAKGVNLLQTIPGRIPLPTHLFSAMLSTSTARDVATKNYLPEDVALGLEKLIRSTLRAGKGGSQSARRTNTAAADRKRRSTDSVDPEDSEDEGQRRANKKARRTSTLPIRRTPKTKTPASRRKDNASGLTSTEQPSRKSTRVSTTTAVNYAESDEEMDDDDDDDGVHLPSSPIKRTSERVEEGAGTDLQMSEDVDHINGNAADETDAGDEVADADGDQDEEVQSSREATPSPVKDVPPSRATRNARNTRTGGQATESTAKKTTVTETEIKSKSTQQAKAIPASSSKSKSAAKSVVVEISPEKQQVSEQSTPASTSKRPRTNGKTLESTAATTNPRRSARGR